MMSQGQAKVVIKDHYCYIHHNHITNCINDLISPLLLVLAIDGQSNWQEKTHFSIGQQNN